MLLRNSAAVEAGIAPGSTLATAHSIVPGLAHHPRNLELESQRLRLLADVLYGYSARVTLFHPAPGTAGAGIALEIGASLRLFGDAGRLNRQIETVCADLGHHVRGRRAGTPLAALILARAGTESLDDVPLRLAAVEPEPLTAERIERLANMGIHKLGQLRALPRRGLSQRLGAALTDYLDRITGEHPDPRPVIQPAEQFHSSAHLLEPLRSKEALLFPMQRLLSELEHWLVARQLGAERLRWRFAAGTGAGVTMPVRFAKARQRRTAFLDITRLELERATLPDEVLDIGLEARRLAPWTTGSRSLFRELEGSEAPDDAGELVDQLRARLGSSACYSLETVDQHTPERAWRAVPPLPDKRRAADGSTASKRPLWLFEPPRPVKSAELTLLRGPERIHTGWWVEAAEGSFSRRQSRPGGRSHRNPGGRSHKHRHEEESAGHCRDYYVARHRNGAECWVFVDPWDRWFLHGYFA